MDYTVIYKILQERSTKDGQTRQKLLLAHYNTSKNEIKKKGVEKEMIYGICIGFLLGALVVNLYLKESEKTNDLLKKTINNLEDDIDSANFRVEQKENLIKDLQEENVILLENASELRQKNNKLEEFKNNVEEIINSNDFTYDQIDKIKELISDHQSQN